MLEYKLRNELWQDDILGSLHNRNAKLREINDESDMFVLTQGLEEAQSKTLAFPSLAVSP